MCSRHRLTLILVRAYRFKADSPITRGSTGAVAESSHLSLAERLAQDASAPVTDEPLANMAWHLKTKAGKARYAKRKSTVEPVFGIIKQVLGLRQFSLRGLDAVNS